MAHPPKKVKSGHTKDGPRALTVAPIRKRKIDVGKALQLRMRGYSVTDIAKKFDVSHQAVSRVLKPFGQLLDNAQHLAQYRQHETDLIDAAKLRMLTGLVKDDKIKKATLGNLAYAFDKLSTNNRLLRGEATSRVDIFHVIKSLDAKLSEIEAQEAELVNEIQQSK